MKCPQCNSDEQVSVAETRVTPYGIRRARICRTCSVRFTTCEIPADELIKLLNFVGTLDQLLVLFATLTSPNFASLRDLARELHQETTHLRAKNSGETRPIGKPDPDPPDERWCHACGGSCRNPGIGIDPVTLEHYFGG